MRCFNQLHPICIFAYFVSMILLIMLCLEPVVLLMACFGAMFFLKHADDWSVIMIWLKTLIPMLLIITIANSLFSHRGVTRLFMFFSQWVTWEAVCYGMTSGLSLAAVILWFACYQKIMTSDKFLYLFGRIAPATSLLISMALNLVPKLQGQLKLIQESQEMLLTNKDDQFIHLKKVLRHLSALLGWSLENTVEQADSMKARGYGLRKRTTFHLFRFEVKDVCFLAFFIIVAGICMIGRILGFGTMDFYPRMTPLISGAGDIGFYIAFFVMAMTPGILEWKEELSWRFYSLKG